jgi:lipoyl-dependent peroxiredoxin
MRYCGSPRVATLDFGGSSITARVGIGTAEHGGFGLTVALGLDAPGIARDEAVDLTNRA